MKKTRISFLIISMLLVLSLAINSTGCQKPIKASKISRDIVPNEVECTNDLNSGSEEIADFAVRLFKNSQVKGENKNILLSPLSVLSALSLTANGARGETLNQMEKTFAMTKQELNTYLNSYLTALPSEEKYRLHIANSIWFTNDKRFTPNNDFLQINADYHKADIYRASFDKNTLKDINNWASNKTDGNIKNVLDDIPKSAVMYLINALSFEAEWEKIYEKYQVQKDVFSPYNTEKQYVEFMFGNENLYLEDQKATGFIKYYKDRKYAFVALLPKENISVSEYINWLDGEKLNNLLKNSQECMVETAIPKFDAQYETEMSKVLKDMGIKNAFDSKRADFSGLGTSSRGNIFINRVIHKTFISVFEKGTKAGAVTVIETEDTCAFVEETKKVYLDRPFVYMLIDCTANLPIFIGAEYSVEKQ